MAASSEGRLPAWKVILVGEEGVGKTSLFRRIDKNVFMPGVKSSIGIDHSTIPVPVGEWQCRLQLWDTGGSERHQSLTMSYYRKACVILFLFSRESFNSLVNLEHWLQDARLFSPNALYFLVACKQDLVDEIADPVGDGMVKTWVEEHERPGSKFQLQGALPFSTSAKTNQGVQDLLEAICTAQLKLAEESRGFNDSGEKQDYIISRIDERKDRQSRRCCIIQ